MSIATLMGWDATALIWRKLVCNADGKLIIDPTEIFEDNPTNNEHGKAPTSDWGYEHVNNASAHHTRYTDSEARSAVGYNGTKYWTCAGINFEHCSSAADAMIRYSGGNVMTNADNVELVCSINLPQGAAVTNVIVKGYDSSGIRYWYLYKKTHGGTTTSSMCNALINSAATMSSGNVIDNTTYSYYIKTDTMLINSFIYDLLITYTI